MTDLKKSRKIGKSGYIIFLYRKSFISPDKLIHRAFSHLIIYLVSYSINHLMSDSNFL